ncbi:hypothetical protein H6S82_20155 [Planktothrix sp. FACHB-1355]|uniref:Uncharacterized protein n=1 Tax=Aerosakkonema funiforme FACHB-1375 TaxID=2949571 RepID=A0A926VG19_9CYAN|nr:MULTISPECIES: hypothetical protein [Oscillatoriales]MBD2183311.1 hypothetical protein [Aerosakkonema funiforme FACHB-1375]MBD3561146.1 hypothetical protein [Planktothrix sp. FACHB-1355]
MIAITTGDRSLEKLTKRDRDFSGKPNIQGTFLNLLTFRSNYVSTLFAL